MDTLADERTSSNVMRLQLRRTMQAVVEIFRYLTTTYALMTFLLWSLQWVLSEQIVGMDLVKSGIHLLLIPSIFILPLCLLLRQGRLSLLLVPSFVAFLISYGVFFLPRTQDEPVDVQPLCVLTFNLQIPDADQADALLNIIRTTNADVVALQELSQAAAEHFAAELAEIYPHQALHPQDYAPAGQGVLSRYPIVADAYWRYLEQDWTLGHQRVALEINGVYTVFYNTHPAPSYTPARGFAAERHKVAVLDVLDRTLLETDPVLMVGDFNLTDQFHDYRRITEHFTDAYRAVGEIGFGFTYPYGKWPWIPPLFRLDYVFYGQDWTGIEAGVWPRSGSSDHAPLLACLQPAVTDETGPQLEKNFETTD